jgi:hypothetical protein
MHHCIEISTAYEDIKPLYDGFRQQGMPPATELSLEPGAWLNAGMHPIHAHVQ